MADKMSKLILPVKIGNVIAPKEFDVSGGNTFVGTTAEWEALTAEQQNAYDCRVLTDDDLDTKSVIDNLTSDSATDALSAKQGKVLKGLIDQTQAQVSNNGDAYDPTRAYKVGDLCIYNNALYRCTTACSAGSWATNQSCFTRDTLVNVAGGTQHIEKGVAPGGTSGERSVSFDRPFTTTPTVVITPINTTTPTDFIRSVVITEITTTGFKFYEIAMNANGLVVGIDGCRWVAVGDR